MANTYTRYDLANIHTRYDLANTYTRYESRLLVLKIDRVLEIKHKCLAMKYSEQKDLEYHWGGWHMPVILVFGQ